VYYKADKKQFNNKIQIKNGYFGIDYFYVSLNRNFLENAVRKIFIIF
jgi:hypothetical protein